jgi:hypothetical protein
MRERQNMSDTQPLLLTTDKVLENHGSNKIKQQLATTYDTNKRLHVQQIQEKLSIFS